MLQPLTIIDPDLDRWVVVWLEVTGAVAVRKSWGIACFGLSERGKSFGKGLKSDSLTRGASVGNLVVVHGIEL